MKNILSRYVHFKYNLLSALLAPIHNQLLVHLQRYYRRRRRAWRLVWMLGTVIQIIHLVLYKLLLNRSYPNLFPRLRYPLRAGFHHMRHSDRIITLHDFRVEIGPLFYTSCFIAYHYKQRSAKRRKPVWL